MLKPVQTATYPTAFADKTPIISLKEVTKTFTQWQKNPNKKGLFSHLHRPHKHTVTALDHVSFTIHKGEFVAYAGPNGAGKSTTMKILSGMLLPNQGEVSVLSLSPEKQRISLMANLGVLFGNRTELWWDHPIIQSFQWKKVVWNIPEKIYQQNLSMVCELLNLKDLLYTFARELSLGQRLRADLALMLLHSPKVILLDEPTLGLDVVAKRQMIDFLKKINHDYKVTILVTSHDMDDLEEMAQRIMMISQGKLAYDGNFDGLREITGNLTRIKLVTANGTIPDFSKGQLIKEEKGVFEYDIDLHQTPIQQVMATLSTIPQIKDVQILKTPIEQVIAKLYHSWQ